MRRQCCSIFGGGEGKEREEKGREGKESEGKGEEMLMSPSFDGRLCFYSRKNW